MRIFDVISTQIKNIQTYIFKKFQVLQKVPFKGEDTYVIPSGNPDLNPFVVNEVYQAPKKRFLKTM